MDDLANDRHYLEFYTEHQKPGVKVAAVTEDQFLYRVLVFPY